MQANEKQVIDIDNTYVLGLGVLQLGDEAYKHVPDLVERLKRAVLAMAEETRTGNYTRWAQGMERECRKWGCD